MLAQGLKRSEIERPLGLSEDTVHVHINNTYRKLGVHSKTEATEALLGWSWGAVDADGSGRGATRA